MKDKTGISTSVAKPKTKFFEELLSKKRTNVQNKLKSSDNVFKNHARKTMARNQWQRLFTEDIELNVSFRKYVLGALNHFNC